MKNVVILGSSTAAGAGSSYYSGDPINGHKISSTSWAGIISTRFPGLNIINQSISGSATKTSMERFGRDVFPFSPSCVILATSIWNEKGFLEDPLAISGVYFGNMLKLARFCMAINATPLIHTTYPHFLMNKSIFSILRILHAKLNSCFRNVCDFMTPVSDPFGNWLPSYSKDGIHPTNVGHAVFADSMTVTVKSTIL